MISSVPARVLRVAMVSHAPSLERGVAPIIREDPGLSWIGSVPDTGSAVHLCKTDCPDVLLMDSASDPDWHISLLLTSMHPHLVIVAVLRKRSRNPVVAGWARLHGVAGMIGLNADGPSLITAIRSTVDAGHYVHPDITAAPGDGAQPAPVHHR